MAVGKKMHELFEYDKFCEKFEVKKTTDDCYTPPHIYNVVADYVHQRYGVNYDDMLRPFYPGGDYETEHYQSNACVVDNPPFSQLAKISEFYCKNNIKFFLFAPTLTLFSAKNFDKYDHIICAFRCEYENGAKVDTSFITNLESDLVLESGIYLSKELNKAQNAHKKENPYKRYKYPDCLLTSARFRTMVNGGVNFALRRGEYFYTRALDEQRKVKKQVFGSGLVISENAENRLKKAKEKANYTDKTLTDLDAEWTLSEREVLERQKLK